MMHPQRKEIISEILAVTDFIAALIRQLEDTHIKLKNTSWTIGTAAAHLVISQKLSKKILQGEENPYKNADPETVAAANDKLLSEFDERRGDKLATMLVMQTEAFLKEIDTHKDDEKIKTHFGIMNISTSLSYNLCHLLIHGSQIAKALNKPLPVQEDHIAMVLPFLKKAMYTTYDRKGAKEFDGTFVIHLKTIPSFAIICKGEKISISEEIPQEVDCHIKADPVSFFLVSSGVINQWKPLLQGKILVWGRKPWLALRLTALFKAP